MTDGEVWWLEGRPAEGGRQALMRSPAVESRPREALSPRFNVRTRVHEYGGGSYRVRDGLIAFSDDADARVHRLDGDGDGAVAITAPPPRERSDRYADFEIAAGGERVYCVREVHGEGEVVNEIVALMPSPDPDVQVVASGHDFFAAPRVSPDGSTLAWLTWDHPRMPWVGTELWRAPIDAATGMIDPTRVQLVAGGEREAVTQPAWSPSGELHWVSDRDGWWNLFREGEPLYPSELEFGAPLWTFGQQMYAFLDDGRIACTWLDQGLSHVGVLDPEARALEELDVDLVPVARSARVSSDGRYVAYVGAAPTRASAVVVVDMESGASTVLAKSVPDDPDPRYISEPEAIAYDSHGRAAHALFYPPRNDDFEAPAGERPPLMVLSHGGPTGHTEAILDLEVQFWTSRGLAVVDVNYAGSTGYGREYRDLLVGNWGVYDVQDCAAAALHLAGEGRVDPDRLIIRGGSAGGYTTLCALAFTDVFHVGGNYYGVADLDPLFTGTHKFESRYDAWLVPRDLMAERSPVNSIDAISAPVIVFQGLEDEVVPPGQSEAIVQALAERGIEHEYHAYEGEGHGFRMAETIVDSLEAELAFYGRILGFTPAA